MSRIELLNSQAEVTGMGWLYILTTLGLNKSVMPHILRLTERHETEPQIKRLIICSASAHRLLRLGNQDLWFRKEKEVKNKCY